jgi:glycerate 2-kinase
MKILVAPDKFKGSLSAMEACAAIRSGILDYFPNAEIVELPMADGGNGTAEILAQSSGGHMISCKVHDPLFRNINSCFGISGDMQTAFVEMAAASGLELLKIEERNCYNTTSYGTGELLLCAAEAGVKKIILCIGGSATNDAGTGMAAALGYRFIDSNNNTLEPVGRNLEYIADIDDSNVSIAFKNIEIEIACDVDNPLFGENGAAWVYGPQKCADREELEKLDLGLQNFADIAYKKFGISVNEIPGAGAAGGLGGGGLVFLQAKLRKGIEIVLNYLNYEQQLVASNWVVTGEGKLDNQSLRGKVISGITGLARLNKVPVIALAGKLDLTNAEIKECGLYRAYSITPGEMSLEEALKNASANLRTAAGKMALENF